MLLDRIPYKTQSAEFELSSSIQPEDVEEILVNAAEEMGYETDVSVGDHVYTDPESGEQVREYGQTVVDLNKPVPVLSASVPSMTARFDGRRNRLTLSYGLGFGLSTERMGEEYWEAVYESFVQR